MSRSTTTQPVQTGPARFQDPAADRRPRSRASSVGAALALLLLVVGVPTALVLLGGVPGVPTSLPTREQLTASLGAAQLMSVLLWVVWLAWLHFTICVLVEVRSALAGVGMPARVPLGGPSQRLARTLVASALLLVTVAGQATALGTRCRADGSAAMRHRRGGGVDRARPCRPCREASRPAGERPAARTAERPTGSGTSSSMPRKAGARRQEGVRGAAARGPLPRQPLGHRRAHAG